MKVKKLVLTCNLLIAALVLSGLFGINLAFGSASTTAEPTLQEWFNQNGYTLNVTTDETGIETFPSGYYRLTILAEIAAYAPLNNLSWYLTSDEQLNYIFFGNGATGDVAYFMADETFGMCLGSPDGYFYTEAFRNKDEKDHALVFINPNAAGYIIAWEDLWKLGDADFQDFILAALTPVKVDVCYCPRTLNLKSKGRWITAIIKLPEGYLTENVDISSVMLNRTVLADLKHYEVYDCGGLHLLVLKFNRTTVTELIKNSLRNAYCAKKFVEVSLIVTGKFLDGLPFQGINKIKVIYFSFCCQKR
ncbi:MAG: DUF4114 domain-containing protein [Candidatus Bathyarchaeia archaeon]